MASNDDLPLGRKAYGKIPHLPGSRSGRTDRIAPPGVVERCTVSAREGEEVVVQEKLDGSCAAVARVRGELVALGRYGTLAARSSNEPPRRFAAWVDEHRARLEPLVREGEWLVGEWVAIAHGTRYRLAHPPFVPFDLFSPSGQASLDALRARLGEGWLVTPRLLWRGGPIGVERALALLGPAGGHGAIDPPEGAMWRVERKGRVVAMAKFVRGDKVNGAFLPENTGRDFVWNV